MFCTISSAPMKFLISGVIVSSLFLLNTTEASDFDSSRGNQTFQSFNKAKKALEHNVIYDRRVTIYCGASFDKEKFIDLPNSFLSMKHKKRAEKMEWEHVVPAENFGRFFAEWREGSPLCIDNRGMPFKGRKCAEKANTTFRYMQSDRYNLYPAIGAVNAERGNKNFGILPASAQNSFGSCSMKISENKVEPPVRARGPIARTYKYMAYAYPLFKLSSEQERLMNAWDKQYPVDKWECVRAKRIERIQGNENPFVKLPCQEKNLW